MKVGTALALVAARPIPETLEDFRRQIDPEWILAALAATGTASLRRRRLPAEQVIWLVLGMALFRNRSIAEVAASLNLALPSPRGTTVVPSALAKAKDRLGEEPVHWLFDVCARHWAPESLERHRWHGLAVLGVDGTTLRVPDSEENRAYFGIPRGGPRGPAAYPQLRLVTLLALRTRLLVAARFGPYSQGEGSYAVSLWSELPDHSLCVVDRGFFGADGLISLTRSGADRHWLTRAKSKVKWEEIERLGEGDSLIRMKVSPEAKRKNPSLPEEWVMRAVRYQRPGFRPQWLWTSLLDPKAYPAREIATLYHERWELELSYDEIKTEMLDREEAIRSRSPGRVQQETWGILLGYNLIRLEMARVADQAKVEPTRISFITSLHLICDEWIWCAFASPGGIPRHLIHLRTNLQRYVLPERRSKRSFPRAVKIKMSSYPRKRRPGPDENAK